MKNRKFESKAMSQPVPAPEVDIGDAEVMLSIRFPREFEIKRWAFKIPSWHAKCMERLPSDRELWFASQSQAIAAQMEAERRDLADYLAGHLAAKLVEMIQSRDTRNGYPPETTGGPA